MLRRQGERAMRTKHMRMKRMREGDPNDLNKRGQTQGMGVLLGRVNYGIIVPPSRPLAPPS